MIKLNNTEKIYNKIQHEHIITQRCKKLNNIYKQTLHKSEYNTITYNNVKQHNAKKITRTHTKQHKCKIKYT